MTEADGTPAEGSNRPIFTVGELSQALKRVVEGEFAWVSVRGEVSGFKRAASGHLYFSLKDSDAVLDAVCWRGVAGRLGIAPEDGLEVVATGKLSTYPGRSRYQIVVERLELSGAGALLALLEARKKALAEEGLFDEARKRALPYLPERVGVVTSPTGARDPATSCTALKTASRAACWSGRSRSRVLARRRRSPPPSRASTASTRAGRYCGPTC